MTELSGNMNRCRQGYTGQEDEIGKMKDEKGKMKAEVGSRKDEVGSRKDENEKPEDLKYRTKGFALRVIKMYTALSRNDEVARVLGTQVLRSGTSVGAHYREAIRARSTAEYISKIEGGMQELEETMYWFELIVGTGLYTENQLADLHDEADQLMAILTTIVKKVKVTK